MIDGVRDSAGGSLSENDTQVRAALSRLERGSLRIYLSGMCLVVTFSILLPLGVHNRKISALNDEVRMLRTELDSIRRDCESNHQAGDRRHREVILELKRINQARIPGETRP